MASKDYYSILGVDRNASAEEIKKAYRKAAHQHHPDKQGGDEARFKEVNEAYQVLGNAEKKSRYDRTGSAEGFPGGGFEGFGGFGADGFNVNFEDIGDIFSSVFSGGFGGGAPQREERGRDIHVEVAIPLEDAFKGTTQQFRVSALITCTTCKGDGAAQGASLVTCKNCSGKGTITEMRRVLFGQFEQKVTCPECEGTGKIPEKVCKDCSGAGRKKGERDVTVEIEPGIQDGQTIVVPGMGDAGKRGKPGGSMGVHVKVKQHGVFVREGDDLVAHVKITPLELVKGHPVKVPSIGEGLTDIEIGHGVDLAQKYRVKGYGMPRFRGRGRGDLLVQFHVTTGKKLAKKEQELIDQI